VVEGQRILLVDDSDDTCTLLARLLRSRGHEVRTAPDGATALALIDQFIPDVAILDIGLPVMDGCELATRLRARLPGSALCLIALSGYSQPEHMRRSRAAGFDHHLVKPVDVKRLISTIAALRPQMS
jgi:CheY-like chemotaxis protein